MRIEKTNPSRQEYMTKVWYLALLQRFGISRSFNCILIPRNWSGSTFTDLITKEALVLFNAMFSNTCHVFFQSKK